MWRVIIEGQDEIYGCLSRSSLQPIVSSRLGYALQLERKVRVPGIMVSKSENKNCSLETLRIAPLAWVDLLVLLPCTFESYPQG